MPPGAIEEVGMAVWRYGGFISLTGVLKNLIAHIACAGGAQQQQQQQRSHFSQHHPTTSNAGISHDILGHIRRRFLSLFSILSFVFTSPTKPEQQTSSPRGESGPTPSSESNLKSARPCLVPCSSRLPICTWSIIDHLTCSQLLRVLLTVKRQEKRK